MHSIRTQVLIHLILFSIFLLNSHRNELNRRGAFDFQEGDTINYRTMLQRLMVELVKDEEVVAAEKALEQTQRLETEIEKSKRIREEKKREALERSKQRQSDPNYFAQRIDANSQATQPKPETLVEQEDPTEEDSQEEDVVASSPFDSFPKKGRSKIFVK
jgi:hypothetical protein